MRTRLNKKTILKGLVVLLCGAIVAILLLEIPTWPPIRHYNLIEAKELLDITYEKINTILEPYDLSVEIIEEDADKYGCEAEGIVALPDGGELYISAEAGPAKNPYYWLSLVGPSCEEEADCAQWDAREYPFFYEIAASLCKNTYTAEQYKDYVNELQNDMREDLETEGSIWEHEKDLGGLLFKHGSVAWRTRLDDGRYRPVAGIYMPLYIQL